MQSTINLALSNAFAKLNLSNDFRDQTIAYLWRPVTPPKPATTLNIEKLNRQQVQRLEQMVPHHDVDEKTLHKTFLAYVNSLDPETFKSLSLVEHMEHYAHPQPSNAAAAAVAPPPPPEDDDDEVVDVNFHMRDYVVSIKNHRVYELRKGVHVYVGQLGMNDFEGMEMPEIED
jgi:hypothetical protein